MRTQDKDVKGLGRTVRGGVTASGGVTNGSGFAATRTGLGLYTVTLLAPFDAPPITLVTAATGGGADTTAIVSATTATTFSVQTTNNGALADVGFYFHCYEQDPA